MARGMLGRLARIGLKTANGETVWPHIDLCSRRVLYPMLTINSVRKVMIFFRRGFCVDINLLWDEGKGIQTLHLCFTAEERRRATRCFLDTICDVNSSVALGHLD